MKKIIQLLCLFIIGIGLNACSSDDKDSDTGGILSNKLNLGASAHGLLSDEVYKKIIIEAVYVDGFKPEQASLNNLMSFLNARLHKSQGISLIERNVPSQNMSSYTLDQVASLEDQLRTQFNTEDTLAIFILFTEESNASDTSNSVTLGTAYRNTSLVMYQKTIEELSGGVGQFSRVDVETTVYEHEFGHIMGLVNVGTMIQSDHEDLVNTGHCDVDGCLMNADLDTLNPLGMTGMMGSGILSLDAQCIADLQANGGK
ncbi:MAG: membrane metalloprotease [Nonlabens sp.]|uniref:membrane metalloprotease n=1 Tax=Nonlabens sp. TaxID=1888209 RepID=UPI003EF13B7E